MKYDGGELLAHGNHYLVKPCPKAEKTAGGLFLPENTVDRVQRQGFVMEVGTGDGPFHAAVGDRVIFNPHAGATLLIENAEGRKEEWKVLGLGDIVAVIRGAPKIRGGVEAADGARLAPEEELPPAGFKGVPKK